MGKTIVLADDDTDIVKVLSYQFEKNGYTVIPAYDGEEAFAKIQQNKPSLAILDYHMPKMNGIEVAEKMHATPETSSIPILFFTGRLDIDDQKIKSWENAQLVFKPCDFGDLLTICEKMS